jgi:molybdopterin-synthase adenylyltransferase
VTLRDDQVERYSRQILLPEVGGRGQERLLAARVVVTGDGPAAAYAASLLAAGGAVVVVADGGADRLSIATGGVAGVVAQGHHVLTLVGRPCLRCATVDVPSGNRDFVLDQAIGALAAAEAMRVVLGIATGGRIQTLDPDRGAFAARALPETDGCTTCKESSRPS